MAVHAIQPGEHSVARPLPEPPRTHKVSALAKTSDALTRALEEWLSEIRLRYTIGGE